MTPTFAKSDVGQMTMTSRGQDGRILEITAFDNVTDTVYYWRGDRFGGLLDRELAPFVANVEMRTERKHECRWLPPGWDAGSCHYCIFPPYAWWDFGVFGDALYDSTLNDAALHQIELISSEPFTISRLEIRVGSEVGGTSPWRLSPSHVRTQGGEAVILSGEGFLSLGSFSITVGGTAAVDVTVVDDTTITFVTPPNPRGIAEVRVARDDGSLSVALSNDLRYYASSTPLLLSRESLPAAALGRRYSERIIATGGIGRYQFTRTSGNLPSGISLLHNGRLRGIPAETGTFAFFVQVRDRTGEEDLRMFFLRVE
jgi:hypothetical protein